MNITVPPSFPWGTIQPVQKVAVERAIDHYKSWIMLARIPENDSAEWDKNHAAFFIGQVLPILGLPIKIRRIAVEAYLSGYENYSDGSSVVPDGFRYGNTKDWQGVTHDYIFHLHRERMTDAYGHYWSLAEANAMYRKGWICDGQRLRGDLWWIGLTIGAWVVWNRKA